MIFIILWLLIGLLSAADLYLNLTYPVCAAAELNPIAQRMLLAFDNSLAVLTAAKMAGTILALGLLGAIYGRWPRIGMAAAVGTAGVYGGIILFMFC